MMKYGICGGAALAALLAASGSVALAADLPGIAIPMSPEPVAYDWQGFYAGGTLGYGQGTVDGSFGGGAASAGYTGGFQLGYNFQADNFVFGAQADIQASNIRTSVAGGTATVDYFGTVRARVGYPIDRYLPYITAGVASGVGRLVASSGSPSDTQTHFGYTVGAGVEMAVTDGMSVVAEYLYTDLGTKTYAGFGATRFSFSTVRLGLDFKF